MAPMRIRELFVASLLTVTFGCPGDDSGDTDANTSANTTQGSTGEPPATDTGEPATDTGEPATDTGEPPTDTSTGTPGNDSSGGDDTAGSSSGGMGDEACESFCTVYFASCAAEEANDYGDEASCVAACGGFDEKTFECKDYHASMAARDAIHCSHANLDGGGVCPAS